MMLVAASFAHTIKISTIELDINSAYYIIMAIFDLKAGNHILQSISSFLQVLIPIHFLKSSTQLLCGLPIQIIPSYMSAFQNIQSPFCARNSHKVHTMLRVFIKQFLSTDFVLLPHFAVPYYLRQNTHLQAVRQTTDIWIFSNLALSKVFMFQNIVFI